MLLLIHGALYSGLFNPHEGLTDGISLLSYAKITPTLKEEAEFKFLTDSVNVIGIISDLPNIKGRHCTCHFLAFISCQVESHPDPPLTDFISVSNVYNSSLGWSSKTVCESSERTSTQHEDRSIHHS